MKRRISLDLFGMVICACWLLWGCADPDPYVDGGSTEAENALALVVRNADGVALKGVHAKLCLQEPFCKDPVAESWSDSAGQVLMERLANGTYQLGLEIDTLRASREVVLDSGERLNLGVLQLADNSLQEMSAWVGSWRWNSGSTADSWVIIEFKADGSMCYTRHIATENSALVATWNDAGLISGLFADADSVLSYLNLILPDYAVDSAHVLLMPMENNPDSLKWYNGLVVSMRNDSLKVFGDVKTYSGNGNSLVGTTWSRNLLGSQGSVVVAFTLRSDATADVQVDGLAFSDGAWSLLDGRLTLEWDGGNGNLEGYYSLQAETLFLLDFDDKEDFLRQ